MPCRPVSLPAPPWLLPSRQRALALLVLVLAMLAAPAAVAAPRDGRAHRSLQRMRPVPSEVPASALDEVSRATESKARTSSSRWSVAYAAAAPPPAPPGADAGAEVEVEPTVVKEETDEAPVESRLLKRRGVPPFWIDREYDTHRTR